MKNKTQAKPIPFTQEQLKELLTYEPDTGKFFWNYLKDGHGYHKMSADRWNKQFGGKEIIPKPDRSTREYPICKIMVCGKHYKAHRLAWKWMLGTEPPSQVDHKDQDSTNNKWSNLCDGSKSNQRNQGLFKSNKSGYYGVIEEKKTGRWRAQVGHGGTTHYLGIYDTPEEANEVVKKKRKEFGFDDNHGKLPPVYRRVEFVPEPESKWTTGIKNVGHISTHDRYRTRFKTPDGKRKTFGDFKELDEACLELLEAKTEHGLEIGEMQIGKRHLDVIGG